MIFSMFIEDDLSYPLDIRLEHGADLGLEHQPQPQPRRRHVYRYLVLYTECFCECLRGRVTYRRLCLSNTACRRIFKLTNLYYTLRLCLTNLCAF